MDFRGPLITVFTLNINYITFREIWTLFGSQLIYRVGYTPQHSSPLQHHMPS